MKAVLISLVALLVSTQVNAYIIREKILKQDTLEMKISPTDFNLSCHEDDFWGESDVNLIWTMPAGLTTTAFNTFTKHNLYGGACDTQMDDLTKLIKENNGLNMSMSYQTKLSVIIWPDSCSLLRIEEVNLKIKKSEYQFYVGNNTVIAQPTVSDCIELSGGWIETPN